MTNEDILAAALRAAEVRACNSDAMLTPIEAAKAVVEAAKAAREALTAPAAPRSQEAP